MRTGFARFIPAAFLAACVLLPLGLPGAGGSESREGSLLFRAFRDGRPVSGLQKEQLRLVIDGRERGIASLAEQSLRPNAGAASAPRLVAVVMNLADFRLEQSAALDFLFAKIVRAGDRLLFCSNNFFLAPHTVDDPAAEAARLRQIVDLEKKKYRVLYQAMRFQLTELLNRTGRMIDGQTSEEVGYETPQWDRQGVYPEAIRRNFIHIFTQAVQSYRQFFLDLSQEKLRRLAGALSGDQQEKWAFVFYERPNFFIPEPLSYMAEYLSPSEMFKKLHDELYETPDLGGAEPARQIAAQGATWHCLQFTPEDRLPLSASSDKGTLRLDRRRIASAGESFFPLLCRRSGGVASDSGKFADFFRRVEQREEIVYRLTYEKMPGEPGRELLLEAAPDCDLVYNKGPQPDRSVGGTAGPDGPQPLRIAGLDAEEGRLWIRLSGPAGKIVINIQLTDKRINQLVNQTSAVDLEGGVEKKLLLHLPRLGRDLYDVVVEAADASGQNDIALRRLRVTRAGWRLEG